MKRICFILTLIFTLLLNAYSQTVKRSPNKQQPNAPTAGATNVVPENSVSGNLTFNGKTVALQYVYVHLDAATKRAVGYEIGINKERIQNRERSPQRPSRI